MRFKNKTVLVTGAVRNTGLAIAEAFASEGATIVLNGRKEKDVLREAARLREVYGATVLGATADVSREPEVSAMFARVRDELGQLDVLVNNAILQGVGYSLVDTPRELLEELFRVNVFGAYHCAQEAARIMLANQDGGSIINIGSNTALRAIHNRTAYIATKGAVDALTRAMAVELGPRGIRVNSVVAGYIHTDRWASLTTEAARRRNNIPLGHEAHGNDIADAVMFLASDLAARITGTDMVIDGGTSCQLIPADCDV